MKDKALDIANYIVKKSIDFGKPITNLKLQKVLYYVQAAFLVEKDEPAFEESVSAWMYGPVVESVYYQFRKYVSKEITEYDENFEVSDDDQKIIDSVIRSYLDFSGTQLISKTHKEKPWKEIQEHGFVGYSDIENKTIKEYYAENRNEIYGKCC